MSVDNRTDDSESIGMHETKPQNAEEIAYQQKCFQSFVDLKNKKNKGNVITCFECWTKWFFTIKECPLCRCKDPIKKKFSGSVDSGVSEDIPGKKLDRPAKITSQCTVCSDFIVEELDDEYETFLRDCGHARCERCSGISFREVHNCLFCGKNINLVKFSKSRKDEDGFPVIIYVCESFLFNCIECLRRWTPEDSKCQFCLSRTTPYNEQDNHDSNVDNASENHEVQNPVEGVACSGIQEIENPVNTTTLHASIFNTFFNRIFSFFGLFRNGRHAEQAPGSNNRELEASNVTASETYIE